MQRMILIQTVENLILNCKNEIDGSKYVQSETEILSMKHNFSHINNIMHGVLDSLIRQTAK